MNLVGVQSNGKSEVSQTGRWFEAIDPQQLKPANLHQAQLAKRLAAQSNVGGSR